MKKISDYDNLMTTEDSLRFVTELVNLSNDAIFVINPSNSRILYVNKKACDNLGYGKEKLISMNVTDIEARLPDHFSWNNHVAELKKRGSMILEGEHKRKDMSTFPVEVSIRYTAIHDKDYIIAVARDISDRKKTEIILQNERDRFLSILESMEDGVCIINQNHDILYLNPVIKKEFGNDSTNHCYKYFHGRDDACPWCRNDEVFAGKSIKWEFIIESKDKTYELFDMPIRTPDGSIAKFEIFHDISEKRHAEDALRQSEKRFRNLVETIPYGIQENDTSGIITFSNNSHCKILGYTQDEMIGRPIWDFLPTLEGRDNLRLFLKLLINEQPTPSPFFTKNVTKDGRLIDVKVDWNYKRSQDGILTGFISVITDITEQIRTEESKNRLQSQLLHSQKMEAIGRLAGGIAHDFGNILTAIRNFSSLGIKGTKESNPYACNLFDHINTASFRAMNLTRQLLTFSRKDFTRIVNVNLNKIIRNLFDMLNHIIGEDIAIVTDYSPDLWNILGDSGKLEQVITNLVVNSRDALPNGGSIGIKTDNIIIDETDTRDIPYSRPGQFVRLTIEDTGIGIAKDNIQHIFEPFFTTKKGISSGLGLSVVYAIINDHNGWITVESDEGAGTAFEVYLPASSVHSTAEDADQDNNRGNRINRGERILLVEDDSTVRISTRMALEKEGYEVVEAENYDDAIRIFKENGSFHLVMSDLVLPGQNGLQLIKELLRLNPGLKVILNSGYIDRVADKSEIEKSGVLFMNKPYDIDDVLTAMRCLLNNRE